MTAFVIGQMFVCLTGLVWALYGVSRGRRRWVLEGMALIMVTMLVTVLVIVSRVKI